MNHLLKITGGLSVLALTAGCSEASSILTEAYEACGEDIDMDSVTLDEERGAMTVNGAGRQEDGELTEDGIDALFANACLQDALDVPDYILDEMGATTSLQGRQTGDWDDLEASWSYHPNNGMNVTFRVTD